MGVATKPNKTGIRYGIFKMNKIGIANITYPCFGVNLANKRYKINIMTITIIDKIGDIKYTCNTDTIVAKSTMIEDGVNALNRESARTIGKELSLPSYPISLLIVRNTIKAKINFTTGIKYASYL